MMARTGAPMPTPLALTLAALLAAGEAAAQDAADARPPVGAAEGSALFVEGRLGGAVCGFCGPVFGVAAGGRTGPLVAALLAETTLSPVESFPSEVEPAVYRFTSFLGGSAGAALRVGRTLRVQLDGELGLQHTRTSGEYLGGRTWSDGAWAPFAGGRARIELPFVGEQGAIGLSAFVREPLRSTCVDVGEACHRLGTTIGVVLHGSVALWRSGRAASATRASAEVESSDPGGGPPPTRR